jgi:predicted Zn-dependent peptidase
LLPTEHPFLYLVSATAIDGVRLADVEAAATACLDHAVAAGVSEHEVAKAKNQLRARLVFENDSVTNLAHQLGYFQTVATLDVYHDAAARIAAVTGSDVNRVAGTYLRTQHRTVGWFNPVNGAHR